MKIFIASALLLFFSLGIYAQATYQLSTPLMKYESGFFTKEALINIQFKFKGSQIRYTLNGEEPKESDLLYKGPVKIKKSFTTMKAKVFSPGFLPSETVSATFIQDGIKVRQASFPEANQKFPGSGPSTLIDNKGGKPDKGNSTWLGYQDDSVEVALQLEKTELVSKVLVDLLEDHGSWVFLPEKIEVFYNDPESGERRTFGQLLMPTEDVIPGARCEYRIIEANQPVKTNNITVRLSVLQSMPESHPGNGKKSWLFIDEIKVY